MRSACELTGNEAERSFLAGRLADAAPASLGGASQAAADWQADPPALKGQRRRRPAIPLYGMNHRKWRAPGRGASEAEGTAVARSVRRQEQRVMGLLDQAQREMGSGRLDTALRLQGEAIALSRELAGQHPDDPRNQLSLASALYSLGSMLTGAGQAGQAVQVLDESEQFYRQITGSPGMPQTAPLIADIAVRRALAFAADGRGASAVLEAAKAVEFYEPLADAGGGGPHRRDFARVCADNAKILARFGDPDMAVGSADRALRIYLSRRSAQNRVAVERQDIGYLVTAASVAAPIHAWYGRADVGLIAALAAVQFAGIAPLQESLDAVTARVNRMNGAQRAGFGQEVAAALRAPAGPGAGGDVAAVVQAVTVFRQLANVLMPEPPARDERLTTLAEALDTLGHSELGTGITRPALDCAIITPGGRCSPQLAPAYALRLAELAVSRLPAAQADGLRIGLEAHYMFATASRLQVSAMRHQLADFGPGWARVLLACSAAFEQLGDMRMALDLAAWAAGAAGQLLPFALLDSSLAAQARQCFVRHGRMLIATGDQEAGAAALAAADSFASLPGADA
jgi:tetratricopeptide (TPR) repeat protein